MLNSMWSNEILDPWFWGSLYYSLLLANTCWILDTLLVNLVNLPHCLGSRTIVEPQYALHGHFQWPSPLWFVYPELQPMRGAKGTLWAFQPKPVWWHRQSMRPHCDSHHSSCLSSVGLVWCWMLICLFVVSQNLVHWPYGFILTMS